MITKYRVEQSLDVVRHASVHTWCVLMQNHTVEKCWPEVNARVNYPIKSCLIKIEENDVIGMDSPVHKFCVSWFTN